MNNNLHDLSHCHQHSCTHSTMTPQYIVCGGGSLWKKSLMCNCHCILCGYIRIDSLCFLCLSKLWPKFCGLGLSISFWMVVTSTIYLSFFLWCAHKLSICTQNVPHSQPFLFIFLLNVVLMIFLLSFNLVLMVLFYGIYTYNIFLELVLMMFVCINISFFVYQYIV